MSRLKTLLRLGIPTALGQLAIMTMYIVDTIFAGRLGTLPLSSVAIANSVSTAMVMAGIGFQLGLDYWISHSLGSRNRDEGFHFLVQGLYLGILISIPLVILSYAISPADSFFFTFFKIPHTIAEGASVYLRLVSWSIIPVLLFTPCRQYLQALGLTVTSMVIVILANFVNVFGNYSLIFGHYGFRPYGLAGAGIATLISRVFMMICIVVFLIYCEYKDHKKEPRKFLKKVSAKKLSQIFSLGFPAAIQTLLEVGVFAISTLIVGRLGEHGLASHQIVLQIASLLFMLPLGLSSAASVLIAGQIGAGNPREAVLYGWLALKAGALFMVVLAGFLIVFRLPILHLFTFDPVVLEMSSKLLLLVAIFQLADATQVIGNGILRGIGNTRASMIANFVGHWMIGLPLGTYLCFKAEMGIEGIWIGLSAGLISVAIALVLIWRKKTSGPVVGVPISLHRV